jgi:hypothetical protein
VARLARARGLPGRRVLETYHDRVRECVAESLGPADWKTCHLSLASALEASSRPDPQALAFHYLEAGLEDVAAGYAAKAGAEAEAALAFEQAAAFYAQSIALRDPADPEISALRLSMAEALTHAGQSPRAAEVFLEAAASAPPELVRKLRRRAAEEFFKSGHLEQALAISKDLLVWAGESVRESRTGAILSMLWSRFRLRRRGFTFRSRDAAAIPADELEKLDILWTVAHGLGAYDIFRAADLQARQFHRALDAGEPHRVMRGMAHETVMQGALGAEARLEVQRLEALTTSLAERIGTPDALARAHIASGLVALSAGRWTACAEHLEKGESMLVTGASYEFHVCQTFGLRARCVLGQFREVAHRYHELLQVARHQGDKHMAANLQIVVGTLLRLVEDEPELAHDELAEAEALLPVGLFTTTHFDLLMQRGNTLLYQGRAAEASTWLESQRAALKRSLLLRTQGMRISVADYELRVDLALMAAGDASRAARAAKRVKALRAEPSDYGQALGLKDDGLLLWLTGRRDESLSRLQEAVMALEACQMAFHAAAVRRVRGLLLGGPVGAELVAQAEAWMVDQGIANPEAATRTLAPIRM